MESRAVAAATSAANHIALAVQDVAAAHPPPTRQQNQDASHSSEAEEEEERTMSGAESVRPASAVDEDFAFPSSSAKLNALTPQKPLTPLVPTEDPRAHRTRVVYASSEFVRIVPYAFSFVRWLLYVVLVLGSGGLLIIVSVWFPQVFTHIARIRLPSSCVGEAHYLLVLIQQDEFGASWIEVPVHRGPTATATMSWWRRWFCCCIKPSPSKSQPQTPTSPGEMDKLPSDALLTRPWIWFAFKKHRYVFNHEKGEFERYLSKVKETLDRMRSRLDTGLDAATVVDKRALFGRNLVDIDPPFIPMLLFTKVVHPYYLFQVFSAVVWFEQGYSIYAAIILVLSAISMAWEIYSEVANCNSLRELVLSDREVPVFRADATTIASTPTTIHESELVPGDIVEIAAGPVVADVLLLSGSCVADEASLTGEAVPINKEAAQNGSDAITDAEAQILYKTSFLHAGSTITRVRDACGPCRGVVLSTGFSTGKGELFRSILFPRAISFEFERDSYRYLAVLATIAVAAFIKRLVNFTHQGYGIGYSIVNSLDLITIAVPPALPLVLSSGVGFALKRLAQRGIFCIDAQRINSCGQLDTFCFDKTGTLTEESMAFVGFDAIDDHGRFETSQSDVQHMTQRVRLAMATCHSLSEVDGNVQGSPLELAMFSAAKLETTASEDGATRVILDSHGDRFRVLKRFPFDAACQRSSVVVENTKTKQRLVFVKGSPEAVNAIATVVPKEAAQRTVRYSADGRYCIAFAVRTLFEDDNPSEIHDRTAIEANVTVMGIALFHNELKPESKGVLRELYDAEIDVRMITGDNALTAVHVAKLLEMPLTKRVAIVDVNESSDVVYRCMDLLDTTDTELWEHLTNGSVARILSQYDVALTGAAIEQLKLDLSHDSLQQVLLQTQIFARIRPTQKAWIVERLMDNGKIVGMCGDGTNDCGALKAAHVGLALSSAEASIVAPFTSKAKAVADVPVLIREGRCALTTSFLGFKFMVLYPVIQLGMASTVGEIGSMLSNNQYIWDDLGIVLGLAITMLYTASSSKLSKERPPRTLFSRTIVASIVGQVALYVAFFASMFAILSAERWFCRRADGMKFVDAALRSPSLLARMSPRIVRNCAFNLDYLGDIKEHVDDIPVSHEGASVWLFGHMQYYCVALAFNLKDRFRKPFYTNVSFTLLYVAGLGVNLWFLLDSSGSIDATFQSLPLPPSYRWAMFGMFMAHAVLALVWEAIATGAFLQWKEEHAARRLQLQAPMTPPAVETDTLQVEIVVAKAEDDTVEKRGEEEKLSVEKRGEDTASLLSIKELDEQQKKTNDASVVEMLATTRGEVASTANA